MTEAEEAMVAAFHRHTVAAGRLPLRLAAVDPASVSVSTAPLPTASRHLPFTGRRGRQGSPEIVEGLYLFVGIDRTSKFAVMQMLDKVDRRTAWEFLEHLLKAVPCRIHTILADNGTQSADQPRNRNTAWSRRCAST